MNDWATRENLDLLEKYPPFEECEDHYDLTVCAIYQTIEWCKEKVLYNWNRRA